MVNNTSLIKRWAVFGGAAAAAAAIWIAPVAGAEEPLLPDDQNEQTEPSQQQAAPSMPDLPNLDQGQNGLNPAQQAQQRIDAARAAGQPSTGGCAIVDGVPTIIPPEGLVFNGRSPVITGPC